MTTPLRPPMAATVPVPVPVAPRRATQAEIKARLAAWFTEPAPQRPPRDPVVRVELIEDEENGGYLLACYREDGSGELIHCPDSAALTDLDAINGILNEHGLRIKAGPGYWVQFAVAAMLDSIASHQDYAQPFGYFEIRPKVRAEKNVE